MKKNTASSSLDDIFVTWNGVISAIDHQFITKISMLRTKAKKLNAMMPPLLNTYKRAIDNPLIEQPINQEVLQYTDEDYNFESEIEPMLQTLDTVHKLCKELLQANHAAKMLSAQACITNLLNSHHFKEGEREIIHFDSAHDFNFSCSELLLNTALFNLFNFTFDCFKESGEKQMKIYFSGHANTHELHLKVICPEVEDNYDDFFENSFYMYNGSLKPGINFCRLALLKVGGNITYQTIEGQEIDFVISVPTHVDVL